MNVMATSENEIVTIQNDSIDTNTKLDSAIKGQGHPSDLNSVENQIDATAFNKHADNTNDSDVERKEEEISPTEPLEYCTEQDLIQSDSESKEETEQQKLLEQYKELPARVYLERTMVTGAITLALDDLVSKRPEDPVDFVAQFLLRFNRNLKQKKSQQDTGQLVDAPKDAKGEPMIDGSPIDENQNMNSEDKQDR